MLRLLALLAVVAVGAASNGATVSADLTIFGTGTVPCTNRVHAAVMAAVPDALPGVLVVGIRLMDPNVTVPQLVGVAGLPAVQRAAAPSAAHVPAPGPQRGAFLLAATSHGIGHRGLTLLYGGAKATGRALVRGWMQRRTVQAVLTAGVAPAACASLCTKLSRCDARGGSGPLTAQHGRRRLAQAAPPPGESQLAMLPSLRFSLQLWVDTEQRGELLAALPGVPGRLPHALTVRGVDTAAAVLTHVADANSEACPSTAACSCMLQHRDCSNLFCHGRMAVLMHIAAARGARSRAWSP